VRRLLILTVLLALAAGCVLDLHSNGIVDIFGSLFEVLDPSTESVQQPL